MRPFWQSVASFLLLSSLAAGLLGEPGIGNLGFRLVEQDYANARWLEATVELQVERDSKDTERQDPDFLDRAEVEIFLCFEVEERGRRAFRFYSSKATYVSLEEGSHRARFYLPPEIVKRDRIKGDPHAWVARFKRGDDVLDRIASSSLASRADLDAFMERWSVQSAANSGILRPQGATPFRDYYLESTPTERLAAPAQD